jgi:nitrogen regulatory protein PII
MADERLCSRVTAFLDKGVTKGVLDAAAKAGVRDFCRLSGRGIVRQEGMGILSLIPGRDLSEDPIDIVSFIVEERAARAMVSLVIESGGLDMPGRGSVISEDLRLLRCHECLLPADPAFHGEEQAQGVISKSGLKGICCIVQQGQGNKVGRIALDTGVCVPSIHLGYGTGVRDKMGLLRVAIPAEKEVITVIAASHDAETLMDLMIDAGKLDQPGKGFIYSFPLRHGLPNLRVSRGERQHAASIDQIVAAIDQMRGGSEWRRRSNVLTRNGLVKRSYLKGLKDMMLICEEGFAMNLVKAAMSAGAGGATVSRFRQSIAGGAEQERIGASREICSMGVSESAVPAIIDALEREGAFSDECKGQVFLRPIEKAFTYIRR